MSMFVHVRGGGGQNSQNFVHVVVERPLKQLYHTNLTFKQIRFVEFVEKFYNVTQYQYFYMQMYQIL